MSGRYQRVQARDADEPESPALAVPNSPPPSFHSRASSQASSRRPGQGDSNRPVDPTLADAFDTGGDDESDDEADDRQLLVRNPTIPSSDSSATATVSTATTTSPAARSTLVQSSTRPNRVYGGGIQSDGVFSNIVAKPEAGDEKDEQPPTYEQAAADSAPPYWETTILAPGLGDPDEVFIDGMPVGSFFSFVWNGMISMSFQIVGFLLTYLLHSTHAAKNGSRAGLGITLIQYGFYMKGTSDSGAGGMSAAGQAAASSSGSAGTSDGYANPPDPNSHDFDPGSVGSGNAGGGGGSSLADIASSEWVAYALMIVGWFILIRAVSDYLKARRHEQLVLQSPDRGLGVAVIAEGENPEHVV